MPAVLLALALLAALGFGIFWFLRANPSSIAIREGIALLPGPSTLIAAT